MLQLWPYQDFSELRQSIFEDPMFAQWTSRLAAAEADRLVTFVTDELEAYAKCDISTDPPLDFEERVWPCLVQAISSDGYYLSMDEILLLASAAKQPVAICTKQEASLKCAAVWAPPENEDVVWLSLCVPLGVRGHFRRLQFVETAEVAEAQRLLTERRAGGDCSSSSHGSSEHDDNEGAPATPVEDSDDNEDVLSDISADYDVFEVSALTTATWRTMEDEDLLIAKVIASELRSSPLCPPVPEDGACTWQGMATGEAIPDLHCGFHGCVCVVFPNDRRR